MIVLGQVYRFEVPLEWGPFQRLTSPPRWDGIYTQHNLLREDLQNLKQVWLGAVCLEAGTQYLAG